jgi:hypothetical protein
MGSVATTEMNVALGCFVCMMEFVILIESVIVYGS